jgi:hypothetical protein
LADIAGIQWLPHRNVNGFIKMISINGISRAELDKRNSHAIIFIGGASGGDGQGRKEEKEQDAEEKASGERSSTSLD